MSDAGSMRYTFYRVSKDPYQRRIYNIVESLEGWEMRAWKIEYQKLSTLI